MKKIYYILSLIMVSALMVSCSQNDIEGEGFLSLRVQSFVSTNIPDAGSRSSAPSGYDSKQLCVEIKDASGNIVKSTNDFENDAEFQDKISLLPGSYTVDVHSANWDGSGSGFDAPYYFGSTQVVIKAGNLHTAKITCTQANVKLTVNYDRSFVNSFRTAMTTIASSLRDVSSLEFVMGLTDKSGYIPAGDFDVELKVVNFDNVTNSLTRSFTDVQPRDHYIFNFKVKETGNLGDGSKPGITVDVDESTSTYTYTFEVPKKSSTSFVARQPNAWSTFAMLQGAISAKTDNFSNDNLCLQWRRSGATDWTTIAGSALTIDSEDNIQYTLKGLSPNTSYEYRVYYDDGESDATSEIVSFTTEDQTALYNGGFENWWADGKVAYPNAQGTSYWDTSNSGAASFGGSITTETTDVVHSGDKAAQLESKFIVIKFAAASLYTGKFGELVSTKGAKLDWGVPFTSRPTALKGFMQYAPVAVDREGSGVPSEAPSKGEPDQCGMFCALVTEKLAIDNTNMSTIPNWDTDDRVVAYGSLPMSQNVHSNGQWKEVNIPLVYRSLTKKPTHLVIVFSASKYGDYFHGGAGSKLYLDDFELIYGDTPSVY